jgi:uncharacterized protein YutE (UPF0331/DUF86 family)
MDNQVILNKAAIIERCIHRVQEEYAGNPDHLHQYTKQDAIILNIQRACEASIDLAMHVVAKKKLGLPQSSRDAFILLEQHHMIDSTLANKLKAMVGFRNIAIHDYQGVNLEIVQQIIEKHMGDFSQFARVMMKMNSP